MSHLKRMVYAILMLLLLCSSLAAVAARPLADDSQALIAGIRFPDTIAIHDGDGNVLVRYGEGRTPAISPDGKWICFGSAFGLQMAEVKHHGRIYPLTFDPSDTTPAWSPNGRYLVFVRWDNGAYKLFKARIIDHRAIVLGRLDPDAPNEAEQAHPKWRGELITWETNEGVGANRKVVGKANGEIFDLVNLLGVQASNGDISPLGNEIAYVAGGKIYRKDISSDPWEPGEEWNTGIAPAFSPTGAGIYFNSPEHVIHSSRLIYESFDGTIFRELGDISYASAAFGRFR